jgi:phosphonate transport system permease protein
MSGFRHAFRRSYWFWVLLALVLAFWISLRVTQPDLLKLVLSAPKARQMLDQLLSPDILTQQAETAVISIDFPIPCGSANAIPPPTTGARLVAEPPCAAELEDFVLRGEGLEAGQPVSVRWRLPDGKSLGVKQLETEGDGRFTLEIQARPIAATKGGKPSSLEAEVSTPGGRWTVTQTWRDVVDAIFVTVFMALLATTAGTLVAAPLSFLAAANITRRGPVGSAVYVLIRSVLNLVRSYEPLVMATIFALMVGFGSPFAGVLALAVVTTASLGKMFSEAVESIDPGPIEAVSATGAGRATVILYAVVPQIVPDFLSFTIYHWDINVRISTIIGFVGGGGIGYYLSQRINSFEYDKAGTALLAIVVVVWALDFLSAQMRKRMV